MKLEVTHKLPPNNKDGGNKQEKTISYKKAAFGLFDVEAEKLSCLKN